MILVKKNDYARWNREIYVKTFRVVNGIIETGRACKGYCQCNPRAVDPMPNCPYRLDIFLDVSEQTDLCDALAQDKVEKHYAEISRYIKNHIRLKKLQEFGDWLENRGYATEAPNTISGLLELETHPKIEGYFENRIEEVLAPQEGEERDPQLVSIAQLGMNALD